MLSYLVDSHGESSATVIDSGCSARYDNDAYLLNYQKGMEVLGEEECQLSSSRILYLTWTTSPFYSLYRYLTEEERKDVAGSYAKRFSCGDHAVELAAMKVYDRWAGVMSSLIPKEDDSDVTMTEAEEKSMIAANRIEWHYHAHNLWLKDLQYLRPEKLEKIKNIPCGIVNGRYDLICPPIAAWRLHKALPKSKLFIIPNAGHSAYVRSNSMSYLFTDCRLLQAT